MMLLIEQNYNNNYIVTMLPILIPLKKVFKDLRLIRCIKHAYMDTIYVQTNEQTRHEIEKL